MTETSSITLQTGDALIIVDVQNDFLPGGNLPVPGGDQIVPVLNRYIQSFTDRKLPIYATRDWHPDDHCSFVEQGGTWPIHCVAKTHGAEFASDLALPADTTVISKATSSGKDAYSGLEGTDWPWRTAPISAHFPPWYRVVFKDVGRDMARRYPKRTQLKYTKQRYRVRNWREYEAGLRKRGDLTLWFSEEAITAWRAPTAEKPGGQPIYSDLAIETGLTVRLVYGLARYCHVNVLGTKLPRE